jgi:adenylate cyclase
MATLSTAELVLLVVVAVELAARRQLTAVSDELERLKREQQGRRRRRGVAPGALSTKAIKTVFQAADMLINKGLGAAVRNSIEDLAGWVQIDEMPDATRTLRPKGEFGRGARVV